MSNELYIRMLEAENEALKLRLQYAEENHKIELADAIAKERYFNGESMNEFREYVDEKFSNIIGYVGQIERNRTVPFNCMRIEEALVDVVHALCILEDEVDGKR